VTNPFFINQNFGSQYGRYVGGPDIFHFIHQPPSYSTYRDRQDQTVGQRVVQEIPKSAVDCGWILVDRIIFTTEELDALLETGSLDALLREAYSLRLAWTFTGRDSFEARELHFKTPVPSITTLEKRAS
jgi:hypothetical protein